MPDYRAMYLELMGSLEDAIDTLISAQKRCEELYMQADDKEVVSIVANDKSADKE